METIWRLPDYYLVRHIQDFPQSIREKMMFSSVDLVHEVNHIPVVEENIPKAAIITPLIFGLRNAVQIFQRFIDEILQTLQFYFTYTDILIALSCIEVS